MSVGCLSQREDAINHRCKLSCRKGGKPTVAKSIRHCEFFMKTARFHDCADNAQIVMQQKIQRYVTFTTLQRSYLDEPATRRQGAQIPVQIGAANKVDDGIYASAVGSIKRSIKEVVFAVVHADRTPQFADALHAFLAGSCENGLCAERVRKHDCRGTNTACRSMDKRPAARSQFSEMDQCFVGRDKDFGDCSGGGKGEPVGDRHSHTRVDAGILRMRSAANDGHHAVTVPETSRCSAHINHLAGDFQTRNDRVAEVRLFSVESLSLENVGAIQPGRADADQEIVWSQLRNRFFHQLDHVRVACVFKTNCPHAVLRNCYAGLTPHNSPTYEFHHRMFCSGDSSTTAGLSSDLSIS